MAEQAVLSPDPAVGQFQEANLFELEGSGASITYSTTSFSGAAQFTYTDANNSVSRSGDDIRVEETGIARLMTINLQQVPDAYSLWVTLLVPAVNVPVQTGQAALQTLAVLTTDRTSLIGPAGVEGQLQTYEALALSGTARTVAF